MTLHEFKNIVDDRLSKTPLSEIDKGCVKMELFECYNNMHFHISGKVTDDTINKLYGIFVDGFIGGYIHCWVYNLNELFNKVDEANADK